MNSEKLLSQVSISPSSGVCAHFGLCGGCAAQDKPYAAQLAAKEALVRSVVAPFHPSEFFPIKPSPDVFYYRNKMEFAFAIAGPSSRWDAAGPESSASGPGKNGSLVLGLREKGQFNRVVNLTDCRLQSPDTPRLLETVRRWAAAEGLRPYDLKRHDGFLRYLVVREGKNTGQRLLHLVTTGGELPAASLLAALDEAGLRSDTVVWSVHQGVADVARGETSRVLKGAGFIQDTLGGLSFQISPTTFFQTNTRGAEVLYQVIKDMLSGLFLPGPREGGPQDRKGGSEIETLFDFYCGAGSIGLFCAEVAKKIIGVEVHAPSVEDAKANAARFGIAHAEFHALDAAGFIARPNLLDQWKRPGSVAVMDPPRPGLQPPVRRLLLQHPVDRWIYVSCNPKALAVDLPLLADVYSIEAVQPVDMFPHTPHVETVVRLVKKQRPRVVS